MFNLPDNSLLEEDDTYLYLNDHADLEYIEGTSWRAGEWHAWDGLYDAYGATVEEAIAELHRNMGRK